MFIFRYTFEIGQRSFISAFSICMTEPLKKVLTCWRFPDVSYWPGLNHRGKTCQMLLISPEKYIKHQNCCQMAGTFQLELIKVRLRNDYQV